MHSYKIKNLNHRYNLLGLGEKLGAMIIVPVAVVKNINGAVEGIFNKLLYFRKFEDCNKVKN